MGRTREAALDGAVAAVAKYGSRKATMGDIAMLAGIAKATLYNHFRTRDDVYRAAVAAEVDRIAAAALERRSDGLEEVLAEAAGLIAEHQAVRRIASDEPAVLARFAVISDAEPWVTAKRHLAAAFAATGVVEAADSAGVDLALRYFASQLMSPSGQAQRRAAVRLLVTAIVADAATATESADVSNGPADAAGASAAPTPSADSAPQGAGASTVPVQGGRVDV